MVETIQVKDLFHELPKVVEEGKWNHLISKQKPRLVGETYVFHLAYIDTLEPLMAPSRSIQAIQRIQVQRWICCKQEARPRKNGSSDFGHLGPGGVFEGCFWGAPWNFFVGPVEPQNPMGNMKGFEKKKRRMWVITVMTRPSLHVLTNSY